ncbi:ATP-binding protein, partial [Psychroserpens sp.]
TVGKINISLSKTSDELLTLSVSDNGVGKLANIIPKGTGFGSQLVQLLTQQLDGEMREEQDNGTKLYFQFKMRRAA